MLSLRRSTLSGSSRRRRRRHGRCRGSPRPSACGAPRRSRGCASGGTATAAARRARSPPRAAPGARGRGRPARRPRRHARSGAAGCRRSASARRGDARRDRERGAVAGADAPCELRIVVIATMMDRTHGARRTLTQRRGAAATLGGRERHAGGVRAAAPAPRLRARAGAAVGRALRVRVECMVKLLAVGGRCLSRPRIATPDVPDLRSSWRVGAHHRATAWHPPPRPGPFAACSPSCSTTSS